MLPTRLPVHSRLAAVKCWGRQMLHIDFRLCGRVSALPLCCPGVSLSCSSTGKSLQALFLGPCTPKGLRVELREYIEGTNGHLFFFSKFKLKCVISFHYGCGQKTVVVSSPHLHHCHWWCQHISVALRPTSSSSVSLEHKNGNIFWPLYFYVIQLHNIANGIHICKRYYLTRVHRPHQSVERVHGHKKD